MKIKLVFVLLVGLLEFDASVDADYCGVCPDGIKHTMSQYDQDGPAAGCGQIFARGVTALDRHTVVEFHNTLRRRVAKGNEMQSSDGTAQPPAANMREMMWDDELATVAQRWTDQCQFGHDQCRNVARFYVGQNAALTSYGASYDTQQADWTQAIQMWYDEVAGFNHSDISPFIFSHYTGHYSQVVWADTYLVGCGFAYFQMSDNASYDKYYVCNYGPAGNWVDGTMYEVGDVCSQCPDGTTCEDALCS